MNNSLQEHIQHLNWVRKRRPWFLRFLCTLSLLNAIAHVSFYFGMAVGGPVNSSELSKGSAFTQSMYNRLGFDTFAKDQIEFHSAYNDDVVRISLTLLVFYLVSAYGVYKMFNLRRDGFSLYTVSQVFISVIPPFLVVFNTYSVGAALFSILMSLGFIRMYASQRKAFT